MTKTNSYSNSLEPSLMKQLAIPLSQQAGKWLVIPRRRESSSLKNSCAAGQLPGFVCYAECLSGWIPAYAGMTGEI
jgi:hypothetical protein